MIAGRGSCVSGSETRPDNVIEPAACLWLGKAF